MTATVRRKGQPLVALAGVIGSWVALRIILPSGEIPEVPLPPNVTKRVGEPVSGPAASADSAPSGPVAVTPQPRSGELTTAVERAPQPIPYSASVPPSRPALQALPPPRPIPPNRPTPKTTPPIEPAAAASSPALRTVPFSAAPAGATAGRWSADGWLLWRRDGDQTTAVPGAASYGASQAGAILRYRLSHHSVLEPRAHLRATTSIDGKEAELAAGIGIRPMKEVPVEILAEGRIGEFAGDTRVRPSVLGVFGPPPLALPLDLDVELYAQAGYVGGQDATAFADGQMRVTRPFEAGAVRLQAGAGAWGGAQDGVSRADVGPTLSATAPLAKGVFARVSVDWRERIAGNAEPGSGPVVTISAGF